MIPVNYSLTRKALDYIIDQKSKTSPSEARMRALGASLSPLLLADMGIHTAGAIQSTFYTLYKGLFRHQPLDFSITIKHLKCLKVFLEAFPSASIRGVSSNREELFHRYENSHVNLTFSLLLSRDKSLYKKVPLWTQEVVSYIQSLSERLKPKEKKGMEDTLEMLEDLKKLEKFYTRIEVQNKLVKLNLTEALSKSIQQKLKNSSPLIRECLTRVLALGLSSTAFVDLIVHIINTLYSIGLIIQDLFFLKQDTFHGDLKEIGLFFFQRLVDVALSMVGVLAGSYVGVVSPSMGAKIAYPSSLYNKIRFKPEDIVKSIIKKAKHLKNGKSMLIPISLRIGLFGGAGNHFVTLLATKENKSLSVSVINKGGGLWYGARNYLGMAGFEYKLGDRVPANVTTKDVSIQNFEKYIKDLVTTMCLDPYELAAEMYKARPKYNEEKLDPKKTKDESKIMFRVLANEIYKQLYSVTKSGTVLKDKSDLFYCKSQTNDDCVKANLLAAMRFHSWQKSRDSKAYKTWYHRVKQLAWKEDRHLLDIALSIPKTKTKPSILAQRRLKAAASKQA